MTSALTMVEEAGHCCRPLIEAVPDEYKEYGSVKRAFFDDFIPCGYRFKPTEEELVCCYLMKKVNYEPMPPLPIPDVQIYQKSPQELTEKHESVGEEEWYFFHSRKGKPYDRLVGKWEGCWRCEDIMDVEVDGKQVALKTVLNYFEFTSGANKEIWYSKKEKTDWKMVEYRLIEDKNHCKNGSSICDDDEEWVLSKIYRNRKRSWDLEPKDEARSRRRNEGGCHVCTVLRLGIGPCGRCYICTETETQEG